MGKIDEILAFWFGDPDASATTYQQQRSLWFTKKAETDRHIREQFYSTYEQARADQLTDWQETAQGVLALILVLDQFPRNMFRGQPQAFATDPQALDLTELAIAQGFDQQLTPLQRLFVYLPLEHSELLEHQHRCVELFQPLAELDPDLADPLDYAIRHRDVIERFGRFPHRNSVLGRPSTPEEIEFLKQPGSSF